MRNTKFRAWDKERNGWVDPDDTYINFNGILYFMMVSRPDDPAYSDLIGDCSMEPLAFDYDDPDRLTLMQYTGLKDKHGKEIYQSDRCAMNSYLTSEVRYKENMGAWYVGGRRLTKKLASRIEVTGNIYENSELLKGANT